MRRLPAEVLMPRGVAESIIALMLEGCGWFRVDDAMGDTKIYSYDGSVRLNAETAAHLDALIAAMGDLDEEL